MTGFIITRDNSDAQTIGPHTEGRLREDTARR